MDGETANSLPIGVAEEQYEKLPCWHRKMGDGSIVAVSETGDFSRLSPIEWNLFDKAPHRLTTGLQAELLSKFFLTRPSAKGMRRLRMSRISARHATLSGGPSLHIIVPTLRC